MAFGPITSCFSVQRDLRFSNKILIIKYFRSNVKMRKNKVEAMEEYKKYTAGVNKDLINLVVVGHVDSGKSTLMGHLLVELGMVSNKMSINNNNFWSQAFLNKKIYISKLDIFTKKGMSCSHS